ncbi:GNAT family N-acetyltransferase [Deinococcus yavapaiensis]|uniref:RimJ/RimL family protein N-acetyltransferase n=1 Tax=Deinococcus yavapaiensis KR-236 TaxID=694435 RepID=A0A318S620_9DEIO|nr:GNAT family protein [Deinococcus yavapaiensis]PYE53150.1 RimJ/RimL family protein N-acetyltransferase [Deinococcus yavapaiensis KR-236]
MQGPELREDTVKLHAATETDYRPLAQSWADPDVTRYETSFVARQTTEWWEAWMRRLDEGSDGVLWVIEAHGDAVGIATLRDIDVHDRHATGSVALFRRCWGRGYASAAVRLRSEYAFDTLGLEKVETCTAACNDSIIRVRRKNGYREVGVSRRERFRHGAWHDEWLGELLAGDWRALRGRGTADACSE